MNSTTCSSPEAIRACFPSPAENYLEGKLDLNQFLVRHPAATFFVRVKGPAMEAAGIYEGDILSVDRSLKPQNGSLVIALVNFEWAVKYLRFNDKRVWLESAATDAAPIYFERHQGLEIWGVVTGSVRKY